MRIAMLSTIAWRTPPRHYGPWETVVSLLTEGLLARGFDVTLFATADSKTLRSIRAALRGMNLRVVIAVSTSCPRTTSATSRAFWGDIRIYLATALVSIVVLLIAFC